MGDSRLCPSSALAVVRVGRAAPSGDGQSMALTLRVGGPFDRPV